MVNNHRCAVINMVMHNTPGSQSLKNIFNECVWPHLSDLSSEYTGSINSRFMEPL